MRYSRTTILAGAAALLAAGAAEAATAETHRMNVPLPDGSVARIEYQGKVAPTVTIEPAEARTFIAYDPFAEFDRIAAMMEAQRRAMLLQMAALEKAASEAAVAGGAQPFTAVGDLPSGVHYTYVSSTTDANGCTRTVEYRSDGSSEAPKITRASTGTCDAVENDRARVTANAVEAPASPPAAQEV